MTTITTNKPKSSTTDVGTLEKLRDELNLALEEKKRVDQNIIDLKGTLAESIAELQHLGNTVAEAIGKGSTPAPIVGTTDSFAIDISKMRDGVKSVFWKWVVPLAVMVLILWTIMSYMKPKPERQAKNNFQLPSVITTAEACALADRLQERRQTRQGYVPDQIYTDEQYRAAISAEFILQEPTSPIEILTELSDTHVTSPNFGSDTDNSISDGSIADEDNANDKVGAAVSALISSLNCFWEGYWHNDTDDEISFDLVVEQFQRLLTTYGGTKSAITFSSAFDSDNMFLATSEVSTDVCADDTCPDSASPQTTFSSLLQAVPLRQTRRPFINRR